MPIVTKSITIDQSNNPGASTANTYVDLAMELSNYYKKNIRQGHNFVVSGIQCTITPHQDMDIGLMATVKHSYIPVTGHSRNAWNQMFRIWKRQKLLAGKVGQHMRFDDLEFGWDSSSSYHSSTRTSTIFAGGIGDSNTEKLCLTGSSTSGTDVCLGDWYNSQDPHGQVLSQSYDQFTGDLIKAAKYGTAAYPDTQEVWNTATYSANVNEEADPDSLGGGIAMNDYVPFPSPLNVLCGVMKINVYAGPDDTATQVEDELTLKISYHIKRWKPLVFRPRRKKSRGFRSTWRSKRGRKSRRRRS